MSVKACNSSAHAAFRLPDTMGFFTRLLFLCRLPRATQNVKACNPSSAVRTALASSQRNELWGLYREEFLRKLSAITLWTYSGVSLRCRLVCCFVLVRCWSSGGWPSARARRRTAPNLHTESNPLLHTHPRDCQSLTVRSRNTRRHALVVCLWPFQDPTLLRRRAQEHRIQTAQGGTSGAENRRMVRLQTQPEWRVLRRQSCPVGLRVERVVSVRPQRTRNCSVVQLFTS